MTTRREDSGVLRNRIRELRKAAGITQQKLADDVGLSRRSIQWIEDGTHGPALVVAIRIARRLRVPVEVVFFLDEEDGPRPPRPHRAPVGRPWPKRTEEGKS